MTKKITISIPDDVAERLEDGDIVNVSAYITEAIRSRIRVEQLREFLGRHGFVVDEDRLSRRRAQAAARDHQMDAGAFAGAWDVALNEALHRADETVEGAR